MAFVPASLEKLLGIYVLARISLDVFQFTPGSWLSPLMMVIGSVTIVLAVMMALIQKNYKRLLAYHAISQVGYMVLGIGTAVPAGIVGGLFHMLNNALYKDCLFMTAGSVEKQTGTTDLTKLGGIAGKMPVTFACFFVAAAAISGVPPLNGFFSKELVYDGALERHLLYYLAAVIGTFGTAASFLKLGHAVYLGKRDASHERVREAPASMLMPMIVIALGCLFFGVYNSLGVALCRPALSEHGLGGHGFVGMPLNVVLIAISVLVLCAALVNHLIGVKLSGSGLHAADHIRHAPALGQAYDAAEAGRLDIYDNALKAVGLVSRVAWWVDRATDWVYERFAVGLSYALGGAIRLAHTGDYATYVLWSLGGAAAIIAFLLGLF
jgi:NADH-quinone oxidoreductase subunit L